MIPPATVQQILDTAQVEEVIEEFVTLKRRGANLLGLCPFHNEKTPSFTVSPAKNLFKCFGCGKGGTPVGFLMEHENLTYPEALRYLAKKYNIEIEEVEKDDEQIKEEQQRQSLLLINEYAKDFFIDKLMNTDEGGAIGRSYFKHRGLLEATIKKFDLGYAPKGGKVFLQEATTKGYNADSLKQLGLVSQSGYDFYRERVVFPFHSISGKIIGFGARQLTDNKKSPKYLNSPESDIYNKRKTLYGLYQAKGEIRKKEECILVEGYTDVLSLYQNGVQNAVASSGTSLTVEQARLIKRFAANVLVLYDGDQAGQNAAVRGLDIFLETDLNVKVVMLPMGHDPDSYVREVGATAFEEYLKSTAQDFILLRAHTVKQTTEGDPVNKSIQVRELITSVAKIRDQMKRALYIREIAPILDVPESALIKETNKAVHGLINKKKKETQRQQPKAPMPDLPPEDFFINQDIKEDHSQGIHVKIQTEEHHELNVIRVLFQFGADEYDEGMTVAQYVYDSVSPYLELIKSPAHKTILEMYGAALAEGKVPPIEAFLDTDNPTIKELALRYSISKYEYHSWADRDIHLQTQKPYEENQRKESDTVLDTFLENVAKKQVEMLNKRIKEETDEKTLAILITALVQAQKERDAIATKRGRVVL